MNGIDIDPGWLWAIGGVLLLIAEIIAPGFFLIFVGVAAILTGLFTLLFGLGLGLQLALFAVYAIVTVMIGKRWYGEPDPGDQYHAINEPAKRLIGRTVTAVSDIDEHNGRVRVGDSEWNARGGPAAAGTRVRITGIDGNCLTVEAERTLPPA